MSLIDSQLYRNDILRAAEGKDCTFLKDKTVLITGGLGLIGSALVDVLYIVSSRNALNTRIFVAARSKNAFDERYSNCEGISFVQYDAMKQLKFDFDADYVIHAAGIASPELYVAAPVETMLSNINGIHNLLEYARNHSVKKLLYISSSEVYGKKTTEEAFEETSYGLVDLDSIRSSYSVAKRASEMLCKSYANEFGVASVIARPGHIYGPSASKEDKRVSSEFAYKAASGETLVLKSSGVQKRSYVYSIDCAMALLTILEKGTTGEAYNIANTEVVTIREMAQSYADAGKVHLEVCTPSNEEIVAFNPMNNSSLNNRKLNLIGYRQSFSPREGFEHTVLIIQELNAL